MKKTIGIVSARRSMAEFYAKIIGEMAKGYAEVYVCAVEDESIESLPECDLYVSSVTSYDMMLNSRIRKCLPPQQKTVEMDVSFSKAAVDLLRTYPEGTKALLLNQNKHMTLECIAQLYHLGISNIEFYPCYPGIEKQPEGDLLFTVGEPDLVPPGIRRAVDIGSRLPSAKTLSEIALRIGDSFFLESDRFRRYRTRLASVEYSLLKISSDSLTTENKLEMILNALHEGIVCVDENGKVTLINKQARELLGVSRSEVLNRRASRVLPMLPFGKPGTQKADTADPMLLNILGRDLGVTVIPLTIQEQDLGAFVTLQEFHASEKHQNVLRLQKARKSHKAKYYFKDIIGESPEIRKTREIARRMAGNDAAVLIQGESGAGKAMFAQAMHNASARAGEAFVTVSCAALRDEQLELELFGCVEGYAGNSAGRTGLIEMAHRGTLFLDSIEAMSPRLQASLLRMLQAGEITRLGSDDPVSIDVRVISSTSEDILRKVREGLFRRDLYYRLNVIQIRVPTLWEHREDIPDLIGYYRKKTNADFELTGQARLALLQHRWEGNVRELVNCIEYLKYTGLHLIDYDDLPEVVRAARQRSQFREDVGKHEGLQLRDYWVMKELGEAYVERTGLGRRTLADRCTVHGNAVTEREVRDILQKLGKMGLAEIRNGRSGTRLTEEGYLKYRQIAYGETPEDRME